MESSPGCRRSDGVGWVVLCCVVLCCVVLCCVGVGLGGGVGAVHCSHLCYYQRVKMKEIQRV